MHDYQYILDQIPIRHDFYSALMLAGIIQGLFLTVILWLQSKRHQQSLWILSFFLLSISLVSIDVYICYTGLIKYAIWLNDSTEFLVLLLAPLSYLFLVSVFEKRKLTLRKDGIHGVPALLYVISQLGYLLHDNAVKLNGYLAAFYPDIPRPEYTLTDYFIFSEWVKDEWRLILLLNYTVYILLSVKLFWKYWRQIKHQRNDRFTYDKYRFARNLLIVLISTSIFVAVIYSQNKRDSGDHFIIIYASICVYFTSFLFIFESRFFGNSWLNDKYDTSGSNHDAQELLQKITIHLSNEKTHLQTGFTLKMLAAHLEIPANYISQAINRQYNQNFNDFINQRRIEEAKSRLGDPAFGHLNIAGIGDSVGFKSKSSFYTAFKKYTGITPAQYLKQKIKDR